MKKKLSRWLKIIIGGAFYLYIFILPWQTKLVLQADANNFKEVSLYASHLLLVVILVVYFIYKLREKKSAERISWIWISLAILELAVLASFFLAVNQFIAFEHYVLFVSGIGLFFLMREETQAEEEDEGCFKKDRVIYVFLASLFFQASFGIYQFLSQSSFVCKYLGLAAHQADIAGTSVVETATGRWLRAYGGFDHPNILGGVLAIALILVAYLLAKKKKISSGSEMMESVFLFIFYFVALIALFFTFSRSAWLALVVGLVVVFISLLITRDRWLIGRFVLLMFFSAVMVTIVFLPYQELVQTRLSGETRLEQKSLQERRQYLGEAKIVISRHWLLGVGTGNYVTYLGQQDNDIKSTWDYQPVHNVFLLLWAESGILAIISFLAFLFLLVKKNRRAILPAGVFVGLIILMLFDHWLISLPFGVMFLFLILSLI
jgi:O-antigen ligase